MNVSRVSQPWAVAFLSLATSVLLSSCSTAPSTQESTTTPDQSLAALYGFYQATVGALGASGWDAPPSPATDLDVTPESCRLSNGDAGIRYTDWLYGPPTVDPGASARLVSKYWKSRGLTVAVTAPHTNDDEWDVRGADAHYNVMFTDNPRTASLSIVMPCITGDVDRMIDRVIAHREKEALEAGDTPSPTPEPQ
ncbi:hypothetical protein [Frondihabitans australicus]|uniref:Uncharacterized protein n=1 Tax=Frondihabitans australicus TaxID=386892 RepID=A0A495IBT7_9MICO|nr:hypothetical protein [Frondihabitans australicus]RKR73473.1 hypothetical protein C8E83_0566 [Frondihabitans australicus]